VVVGYRHGYRNDYLSPLLQHRPRKERPRPQQWQAEVPLSLLWSSKPSGSFSERGYTEERKEEILRAYQERSSLRGLRRTFGVSPTTVMSWLKKR
jgi:hypothetical protein